MATHYMKKFGDGNALKVEFVVADDNEGSRSRLEVQITPQAKDGQRLEFRDVPEPVRDAWKEIVSGIADATTLRHPSASYELGVPDDFPVALRYTFAKSQHDPAVIQEKAAHALKGVLLFKEEVDDPKKIQFARARTEMLGAIKPLSHEQRLELLDELLKSEKGRVAEAA